MSRNRGYIGQETGALDLTIRAEPVSNRLILRD